MLLLGNWVTMAVRSIDQKSAFKLNFNIYYVYLKFQKIHALRIHPVEWFQESQDGFHCWVSCSLIIRCGDMGIEDVSGKG